MTNLDIPHTDLAREIHADNIAAGWWSNIETGESIVATRNRPEMLMLIVSELSEAHHGWVGDLMDDKLPHLPMFDVELADTAIRIYDLLGCEAGDMNFDRAVRDAHSRFMQGAIASADLMRLVNTISDAMEGYRKGNRDRFLMGLWKCLGGVYAMAECYGGYDLSMVIEAKREINRHRADHKIANRLKGDGKKF